MHHSRGWHARRLATRPFWALFLLAIPAGPALAQTDVDTGFSGTITVEEIINLIGPGGTVNGAVVNDGQLWFNNPDLPTQTISAPISGNGAVLFFPPATMTTLSASNSWTGGTFIYGGTVAVTGELLGGSGVLEVDGGEGTLFSVAGGVVTGGDVTLAGSGGSVGDVSVTSGGSWTIGTLYAGFAGSSTVTVNAAQVNAGTSYFGYLGTGRGDLTITSGSFLSSDIIYLGNSGSSAVSINGGLLQSASDLYFGYQGGVNAVLSAGAINAGGILFVGKESTSSLSVNGGSVTSAGGVIGQTTGGVGTVTMNAGSWTVTNDLEVGSSASPSVSGGVGTLTINGGNVTSARGLVGNLSRSIGNVSVISGTWNLTGADPDGNLRVGNFGSGTMSISGGLVSGSGGSIGFTDTGNGSLIVNGGQLNLGGLLNVGNFARGSLLVSSGTLNTAQVIVGAGLQAAPLRIGTGTVSVTGGTWNNSLSLTVGFRGNGTYTQSGGYVSAARGFISSDSLLFTSGSGSVTVTGGTLAFDGNLSVGNSIPGSTGTASLTVANGGFVSVGDTLFRAANGTINLNQSGTLSIGVGGSTGSLPTDLLDDGLLIFNRLTDYTYLNSISGTGSVAKYGASVLTIAGTNTYTGLTDVFTGTLSVLGQLGNTSLTVHGDAALIGTGVIAGPVTIAANGIVMPGVGGVGTLTVGDYTMNGSTSLAVMQITGSSVNEYDRIVAQTMDPLAWGGGSLSFSMTNTTSYPDGTEFYLFNGFGSYSGGIAGISLNAGGTDFAGLSFADAGGGVWRTNRNSYNQFLKFDTSTGTLVVVPEPATIVSLLAGLACCGAEGWRRRRRRTGRRSVDEDGIPPGLPGELGMSPEQQIDRPHE